MTKRELIDYCLSYPGAYEDYPFDSASTAEGGSWAVIRHRGNRKSFAMIYERGGLCINLKCEPMRALFLREAIPGVSPAYHQNKEHWNTVLTDVTPWEDLENMIQHSYDLTAPKRFAGKK